MVRLYRIALGRPRLVLALWILLLAALSPGLAKIELRTDGLALVPSDADEVRVDRSIREEFGVEDQLVVVVETSDPRGIYNPVTLEHAARISRDMASLPGVQSDDVVSLATEPGDHVRPGTLDFRTWLDPLPATEAEIASLRAGLERAAIYTGTLISRDSPPSATAILVGVREGADRQDLYRRSRAVIEAHPLANHRALVVGAPVVESQMGQHLLRDLVLLVPVAFLAMGAVLYLFLRRLAFVLLPLLGVGACLLATLALMGWFGAPIYLTCLVIPVILTAIGVASAIHLLDRYQRHLGSDDSGEPRQALRRTMEELARAVVNTSVTTALGFLSFALSPVVAVRVFGVFAAAGTLLLMAWSLTALPASLALLDGTKRSARPVHGNALRERIAAGLSAWARSLSSRRGVVAFAFSAVILLSALGATRIRIEDSWIEGFSRSSEVRRATERVDELFGGTHLLRLRLVGQAARHEGRVVRDAFDNVSMLLPSVVADPPGQLVHHRLEVRPAPGTATGAWDRPMEMIVTDASLEGGDTRLFLTKPGLPKTPVRDLLPYAVAEFDYVLDGKDRLRHPAMLAEIRAFESFLADRRSSGVGAVLGPWAHLLALNRTIGGAANEPLAFLTTRDGLAHTFQLYVMARGERRLREIYGPAGDRALVTLLLRNPSYATVSDLLSQIRAYEREHLAPLGVTVEIGGDVAVSQSMIGGIVSTQVLSLLFSILTVLVMTSLLTRSVYAGLVCVVPCAVAVLVVFGLMGALSIPLGIATSMFAGMTIGVGDDYAIHLWERSRSNAKAGRSPDDAVALSMAEVGPAIVVDALAVGLGFSVLVLSQVPTNARLGALLAFSVAGCLLATIVLLPIFLRGALRKVVRKDPLSSP